MLKKRTFYLVLLCLIPLSFTLIQCFTNPPEPDPRGETYAGSQTCIKCHSDIYNSYIHTAHFQTSQPATGDNVHGSFNPDSNTYEYASGTQVKMINRNDSLLQAVYVKNHEMIAVPFDITVGIAKAQTYLYWRDNMLFQLPVSYFNGLHSWANSPGYAADEPTFSRPILRRCLECHASNINQLPFDAEKTGFDKASIVYGIDCERCHGPAKAHVTFHTEHPDEKIAKFITTYKTLTRAQKMDACALCHSGSHGDYQKNTFFFKMGDSLGMYRPHQHVQKVLSPDSLDVHVNQNALLSASKCFIMSNMDCNTCHNTHNNERGSMAMFTQKCLDCHSEAKHNFCPLAPQLGTAIKTYCINCHMPQKDSHVITLRASEGKKGVPYLVRTHRIAIYPEETKKIMSFIKVQTPAK